MSKVIIATVDIIYFKVPEDWEMDDIEVKYDRLYYKGNWAIVPRCLPTDDDKYPDIKEAHIDEYESYFDCEDEPDEEEEEEEENEPDVCQ